MEFRYSDCHGPWQISGIETVTRASKYSLARISGRLQKVIYARSHTRWMYIRRRRRKIGQILTYLALHVSHAMERANACTLPDVLNLDEWHIEHKR
jgi:hypothetical protein